MESAIPIDGEKAIHTTLRRVHGPDVDIHASLSNVSLFRRLQIDATEASAAMGFDVPWYLARDEMWLVRRTWVERLRPITLWDRLHLRTWCTSETTVRCRRFYELKVDGAEEVVARGVTDWVYVNRTTERPARPPQEVRDWVSYVKEPKIDLPRRPQSDLPSQAYRSDRRVPYPDVDNARHVNNAVYVGYLEDDLLRGLGIGGWEMGADVEHIQAVELDIHYVVAGRYADVITGCVWVTGCTEEGFTCEHRLLRGDEVLMEATTRWQVDGPWTEALRRAVNSLRHEGVADVDSPAP